MSALPWRLYSLCSQTKAWRREMQCSKRKAENKDWGRVFFSEFQMNFSVFFVLRKNSRRLSFCECKLILCFINVMNFWHAMLGKTHQYHRFWLLECEAFHCTKPDFGVLGTPGKNVTRWCVVKFYNLISFVIKYQEANGCNTNIWKSLGWILFSVNLT